MIKQIRITSFKGFDNFTVPFEPFTNLVGLNSRGKTTVLQAIKFVYKLVRLVFGNEERPNVGGHIPWEADPASVVQQFTLNDPDAIWLNRNTATPCKIVLTLVGGVEINAQILGRNRYALDIAKESRSFRQNPLGDEEKQSITDILAMRVMFVPPIGGTSPGEKLMPWPAMLSEIQQGRISETFRNNLYWLYSDGQKDQFDQVVDMVERYIPESRLLAPSPSHDNPMRVLLEFRDDGQDYDISLSGGGLRTLINLASGPALVQIEASANRRARCSSA